MNQIKSPFNFIPLNTKVFYPDWAELISQDIPFENGISGVLDITIAAQTPIFVRNGHTPKDKENNNLTYKSFSRFPDDTPYIPATSIKGVLRSAMRILANGKMQIEEDHKYLSRRLLDNGFSKKENSDIARHIKCGWLRKDEKGYFLYPCKSEKIALWDIDYMFDTRVFKDAFSNRKIDLNSTDVIEGKEYDRKSGVYKYALLKSAGVMPEDLENLTFIRDGKTFVYDPEGDLKGTIVLYGQPNIYPHWGIAKGGKGKYKEFIFIKDNKANPIPIAEDVFDRYDKFYKESEDWKFHRQNLETKGIPVFYYDHNNTVKHFGLSSRYRALYEKSIKETIHASLDFDERPDLSDCIFGYTSQDRSSLKGRVMFSNFICDNPEEDAEYILALNGPKPNYYPLYICQNHNEEDQSQAYNTYTDGKISGRKKYVLRNHVWKRKSDDNDKVNSYMRPLKKGSEFKGKVYFHNLLPQELGALLSVLTFHGTPGCYHQLGQAKPYGFGKVSFSIGSIVFPSYLPVQPTADVNYYLTAFESCMPKGWLNTSSITELFAMSSVPVKGEQYEYMNLGMNQGKNEFNECKKLKLYLHRFSSCIESGSYPLPESRLSKYSELIKELQSKSNSLSEIAQAQKNIVEQENREKEIKQKELEKRAAEKREKEIQEKEAAKQRAIEEQLRITKEKEDEAKRKVRDESAALGLRILEAPKANGDGFKVTNYKQIVDNIKRWKKKANCETIPSEQYPYLWTTIQRLYVHPEKTDKKDWVNFSSKIWKGIADYTSESQAKEWFALLNKRNNE